MRWMTCPQGGGFGCDRKKCSHLMDSEAIGGISVAGMCGEGDLWQDWKAGFALSNLH